MFPTGPIASTPVTPAPSSATKPAGQAAPNVAVASATNLNAAQEITRLPPVEASPQVSKEANLLQAMVAQTKAGPAPVNADRVAQLQRDIAEGKYKADPANIASKMLSFFD